MQRKRSGNSSARPKGGGSVPLPIHPDSSNPPRRNYARWRAISLSLVYVVFAIHIIHWKITGTSLAPLELNEVMYTLELGIITAGFLFMCLLVLGTMIFGRFFCSWACHIMVLQDLCAWLLRRVGIRAKPIRSRLFLWIPPFTACYMFLWPQIVRTWHDRALPTFHLATDAQGWASFATTNFWRNLPGPWIIALTFVMCGFVIVYLLGSRTFCTYVCPYGAVFALADRFSPARILVNDRCRQCGQCTAACTSGVRVHDEVRMHGMIVNPACLKDLDCVAACPQEALRLGFSRPALFKSKASGGRFGVPYEFSMFEEMLMAIVFVTVLLSMRGLYAQVPFLLSLALGVMAGYVCVQATRLVRRSNVALGRWKLKTLGHVTAHGYAFSAAIALMFLFISHSAFIRYHEYVGLRGALALQTVTDADQKQAVATAAFNHLTQADRWGLFTNERASREIITVAAALDRPDDVDSLIARFLERNPYDAPVNLLRARLLADRGHVEEAARRYQWITEQRADNDVARHSVASAYGALGAIYASRGAYGDAVVAFERSIELDANRAQVQADLGGALAELGRMDQAVAHLREAVRLDSSLARAQYNLGTILAHVGAHAEAVEHYEAAARGLPDDADLLNNLGAALMRLQQSDRARLHLERALALNPNHPDAHFNLGALLAADGDPLAADAHFRAAVRLDARYAAFLEAP